MKTKSAPEIVCLWMMSVVSDNVVESTSTTTAVSRNQVADAGDFSLPPSSYELFDAENSHTLSANVAAVLNNVTTLLNAAILIEFGSPSPKIMIFLQKTILNKGSKTNLMSSVTETTGFKLEKT
jgi:hypothetical protein